MTEPFWVRVYDDDFDATVFRYVFAVSLRDGRDDLLVRDDDGRLQSVLVDDCEPFLRHEWGTCTRCKRDLPATALTFGQCQDCRCKHPGAVDGRDDIGPYGYCHDCEASWRLQAVPE